jgi:hypothetical protein
VVVTVVMRYDSSACLRLTVTDVDKYVHHPRTMETAMFSRIAGKDHSDLRSIVISTDHLFLNIS